MLLKCILKYKRSLLCASIFYLVLMLYTSIAAENLHQKNKEMQFSSKLTQAQESFYDVYYELVKQDYFSEKNDKSGNFYNNNLIISEDALQTGTTLLTLISWLSKKNDQNSLYLLKKINKYLFLHFHKFVCELDQKKNSKYNTYRNIARSLPF